MAGQKVSEDDGKGSSCRHQGVLEPLSSSEVGGMNEVGRRMVSVVGRPARLDQSVSFSHVRYGLFS